jgi:hypothetical protein
MAGMSAARVRRPMRLQGVPGSCPGQQKYEGKDMALSARGRAKRGRNNAGGGLSIGLRNVIGVVRGHRPGLCWQLAAVSGSTGLISLSI